MPDAIQLFRIAREKYSSSLHASGIAGRWNKDGQHVIYTSSSRSLAALELVVHRSGIRTSAAYKTMIIEISNPGDSCRSLEESDLFVEWRNLLGYSRLQAMGNLWYQSCSELVLRVPSALIPQEYNYIINTKHPDFASKVRLVKVEEYLWDFRFLDS